MSSVFEIILQFFSSLFFPSNPENVKRKKLRAIQNKLKNLPFSVFTKDGGIRPEFAVLIYELNSSILLIKSILEETIASPDVRVSSKFQDLLIDQSLQPEQIKQRELFTFEKRSQDLETEYNSSMEIIEKKLQNQVRNFNAFIRSLQDSDLEDIENTIYKIFALYDLCCFDFNTFLMNFNKSISNETDSLSQVVDKNDFTPVFIDDVMQELLDFNFVLQNCKIDESLIKGMQIIYSKIAGSTEDKFFFIAKQLQAAENLIHKKLGYNTILYMLRIAKKDPYFEDNTPSVDFYPAREYLFRLESKFKADSKRLLRFYQETKINKLVTSLFGDKSLFMFKAYNDRMNERLQSCTNLSFEWIRPLEVIRTFTKRVFEQYIKNFIKVLFVEGSFYDKAFQKSLSNTYYYCEGLTQKFEDFEVLFHASSEHNLANIEAYLKEIESGGNFEKKLAKTIDFFNVNAKKIIQDSVVQYTNLKKSCTMIVEDSKKSLPTLIGNIGNFSGASKGRNTFSDFEKQLKLFDIFLDIMKNYAVLADLGNLSKS